MINTVIITLTNRQPAASLTHMDASMEVDRWLQCTSPPNTCLLEPIRVQILNGILIGSAVFAQLTPERRYILRRIAFPLKFPLHMEVSGPHLIHDSFDPSAHTSYKRHLHSSAILVQLAPECPCNLHRAAAFSPYNSHSGGDLEPHQLHGCLGPTESSAQTASRSVQPFLQLSLLRQTDRPR